MLGNPDLATESHHWSTSQLRFCDALLGDIMGKTISITLIAALGFLPGFSFRTVQNGCSCPLIWIRQGRQRILISKISNGHQIKPGRSRGKSGLIINHNFNDNQYPVRQQEGRTWNPARPYPKPTRLAKPTASTGRANLITMTIAVCPGSYDPVTAGHLDVIERCTSFFENVHVVVAVNSTKTPLFSEQERVGMIRQALDEDGYHEITVSSTTGLITDYCRQVGASVIVKGLRQNGDYEAELGMALVNRKLADVETLFLPADPLREHISSTIVKDVASHGGDITGMVPNSVVEKLTDILNREKSQ